MVSPLFESPDSMGCLAPAIATQADSGVAVAAIGRGPLRVFVGELPLGRAGAAVLTLASARDPLPDGGRVTACWGGARRPHVVVSTTHWHSGFAKGLRSGRV